MSALILISGAGQLGSRYLQGMVNCKSSLRIYVHDCHQGSLVQAKQRWEEVLTENSRHNVSYHTSLKGLPESIDIAVVATTANVRTTVVGDISENVDVKFWVLEKILAQSENELADLKSKINVKSTAWVNTSRRMMPWHKELKSQFNFTSPLTLNVTGGMWGLACNSIHYLDLLTWWTGETLEKVSTEELEKLWSESKRKGFWEVTGTLSAIFSEGSRAQFSASNIDTAMIIKVTQGTKEWIVDEANGKATGPDGKEIHGRLSYQSEMTGELIDSILETDSCDLPTLDESILLHQVFIRSMQEHWDKFGDDSIKIIPIT